MLQAQKAWKIVDPRTHKELDLSAEAPQDGNKKPFFREPKQAGGDKPSKVQQGGSNKPLKVFMTDYDCEVPALNPWMPAKKRLPEWSL